MSERAIVWHDLECHGYDADLPLWRELAGGAGGAVLEVGAGTGRVALELAAAGAAVTALDHDRDLLAELDARAAQRGVRVTTVCADATALPVAAGTALSPGAFALVAVPMQTIQLFGERAAFMRAAHELLQPGGLLALAVAENLEIFEGGGDWLPEPDVEARGGWRFASQPVSIHYERDGIAIDRLREAVAPDGTIEREADRIVLADVSAADLEIEGAAAGFTVERARAIPPTDIHVGSKVVMLRG